MKYALYVAIFHTRRTLKMLWPAAMYGSVPRVAGQFILCSVNVFFYVVDAEHQP